MVQFAKETVLFLENFSAEVKNTRETKELSIQALIWELENWCPVRNESRSVVAEKVGDS
jgi:hypothetical protein